MSVFGFSVRDTVLISWLVAIPVEWRTGPKMISLTEYFPLFVYYNLEKFLVGSENK